jgi:hypothetical protein
MTAPTIQPVDGMPLVEFVAARAVLRQALARFPEATCHSCTHFAMGACTQFGEVPAEFQKEPERCESWQFSGIPF